MNHADLPDDLCGATELSLLLTTGHALRGRLLTDDGDAAGWWRCDTDAGTVYLRPQQIAAVAMADDAIASLVSADTSLTSGRSSGAGKNPGKGTSKKTSKRSSAGRGRPWDDDDLRLVANAFLDDVDIGLIATEFNRSRAQIKQLRFGFEAARGNLDPDQIDDLSRSWVNRWQQLLSAS